MQWKQLEEVNRPEPNTTLAGRYFYVMVMGRESEVKTMGDVGPHCPDFTA